MIEFTNRRLIHIATYYVKQISFKKNMGSKEITKILYLMNAFDSDHRII